MSSLFRCTPRFIHTSSVLFNLPTHPVGSFLPVITPALFQPYPSAVDEWTLAALMRNDGSLQRVMEAHYDEFIVRTIFISFCDVSKKDVFFSFVDFRVVADFGLFSFVFAAPFLSACVCVYFPLLLLLYFYICANQARRPNKTSPPSRAQGSTGSGYLFRFGVLGELSFERGSRRAAVESTGLVDSALRCFAKRTLDPALPSRLVLPPFIQLY
jgi:hypothetical protein